MARADCGGGVERPPTDPDRYEEFAAGLPIRDLYDSLRQGEPLDDPTEFRYPASTRHRYERLHAFPDGLLVAGDAVCSFNPIYGQGMTVAALDALACGASSRGVCHRTRGPGSRRQRRSRTCPGTSRSLPTWGSTASRGGGPPAPGCSTPTSPGYHAAGAHDPALGMLFAQVAGLVAKPARLLYPATVARVVRGNLPCAVRLAGLARSGAARPGATPRTGRR